MSARFITSLLRPAAALGLLGVILGTSVPAFASWNWDEDFAPDFPGTMDVMGSQAACSNDGSDLEIWVNALLDSEGTAVTPQGTCSDDLVWS